MIRGEPQLCDEDDRTKDVDVNVGNPFKPDAARKLELVFWDFAGHSEYYSTHQIFLSKGALHLLFMDIERFSKEPSASSESVDVWLDALQSRVPGSSVLVIAMQIDRLTDDVELAVNDLRLRLESHLNVQQNEIKGQRRDRPTFSNARGLVFHGIETVACWTCG